jgi:hypothetical protein
MSPYRLPAEPSPPLLVKRERVRLLGKDVGFIDEALDQAMKKERSWRRRDMILEWSFIIVAATVVGIIFSHYCLWP